MMSQSHSGINKTTRGRAQKRKELSAMGNFKSKKTQSLDSSQTSITNYFQPARVAARQKESTEDMSVGSAAEVYEDDEEMAGSSVDPPVTETDVQLHTTETCVKPMDERVDDKENCDHSPKNNAAMDNQKTVEEHITGDRKEINVESDRLQENGDTDSKTPLSKTNSQESAKTENSTAKEKPVQYSKGDFISTDSEEEMNTDYRSESPVIQKKTVDSVKTKQPGKKPVAKGKVTSKVKIVTYPKQSLKSWRDRDTEEYRSGYPGKKDNLSLKENWLFYQNKMASTPKGDYIDNIHKKWFGKYDLLESHHGYIQWLFPIRAQGMNWQAQELQIHEAKKIQSDPQASRRVLESYKLMLHFYGMKLADEQTGEISRDTNWQPRFKHLNGSSHNFLRITRILKSLGELGLEHVKAEWVRFLIHEAYIEKTLPRLRTSLRDYWIQSLRKDKERETLAKYVQELEGDDSS